MVFGLVASKAKKQTKKNAEMLDAASKAHFYRRVQFRANAVKELKEVHPDLVFLMNEQSHQFAGFAKKSDTFITGLLYDKQLPDLFDLEENFKENPAAEGFASRAMQFVEDVRSAKAPRPYNWMTRTTMADGYSYEDNLFPYEIRLYKNDRIVGRSGKFSPKPTGYFEDILRTHIIHDLKGATVSTFKVAIHVTNFGEMGKQLVSYAYQDTPRRDITQNYKHFNSVRRMFLPFLEAIEESLTSEDGKDDIFSPREEDIDDEKIGLPAA